MGNPLLLLATANATHNLSIFDPASQPADSIRNLTILVFAITGFIFLVVETILIYCIVRFRRRALDTREPPQLYGSKSIEIAWTAAPALIVVILVLVSARTLWEVHGQEPEPSADDNALFVTVIGHQWWWEYTYDHYNGAELFAQGTNDAKAKLTTANELHIPVSANGTTRPVHLTLKTADVNHSFWVPRLAGKTDLIAGRTNRMRLEANQTGLFVGQCAEFCGTQHANMLLRVVVQEPDDFDAWLKHQREPAVDDARLAAARKTLLAESCVTCHRVRGTSAQGTGAPDLTHLMSRQTLASGMIENDAEGENLRRWILDPQTIKPGCLMAAFPFNADKRDSIVRYLLSLR